MCCCQLGVPVRVHLLACNDENICALLFVMSVLYGMHTLTRPLKSQLAAPGMLMMGAQGCTLWSGHQIQGGMVQDGSSSVLAFMIMLENLVLSRHNGGG